MGVKKGYKQTELGVIPNSWVITELGQLATVKRGASPRPIDDPKWFGGDVGWVRISDVTASTIYLTQTRDYLSRAGELLSVSIQPGELIMSIAASVGFLAISNIHACIHDGFIAFKHLSTNLDTLFLYYYLSYFSESVTSAGQTGSQKNVNAEIVKLLRIALPPVAEQRRIAEVLSDVDAQIAALDALIAKKRAIKQGVMQELLIGRRRLPGFSGEWETRRLGEIGVFSKGAGIKKEDVLEYGIPCIRYGEIYTHYENFVTGFFSFIDRPTAMQSRRLFNGELLFTGSGETAEEIGKCVAFVSDVEAYAGGDIIIFSQRGQNSVFLAYLMNTQNIIFQKAKFAQGDAVVHIGANSLAQLEFRLPTVGEQTAIAKTLIDLDDEIAALDAQRRKTAYLKQAMMHELLTGKTRLL